MIDIYEKNIPIEREHRFTIKDEYRETIFSNVKINIKQGYLFKDSKKIVRVRTCMDNTFCYDGCEAFLTIKITLDDNKCEEYEYPIPMLHAQQLMQNCEGIIEKERFLITHSNRTWEVDIFKRDLDGLFLAEIELAENENLPDNYPDFINKEITHIRELKNVNLINKKYNDIKGFLI